MKFRLKAFGIHVAVSAAVLTLTLTILYLGWYHWPGWYLTSVPRVVLVMAGVDVALGPLLTLVIANPVKPRRELLRDLSIIGGCQLLALAYGSTQLWNGRPLYYVFADDVLQLVQAYDLDDAEVARARAQRAPFAPHWYSLPRWVYAPMPQDKALQDELKREAATTGLDLSQVPRVYQPWSAAIPALRAQLKTLDEQTYFAPSEKADLERKMRAAGLPTDIKNAIPVTGRGRPLLAVFDPASMSLKAILIAAPYSFKQL
jgi:hypothetical protein